nr:hypothetical protein [Tanacetum cinerariifolium]
KPKRVKDSAYHKEKMLLCKKAEQVVPLQAEQYDWLADTDEEVVEQELEAHYSYMAKIQEVPTADSGTDSEPLEQVQNDAGYNVFATDLQHSDQSESVKSDDERVELANLIANLKLDVDENKMIQKQLKKANTTLAQELKECKTILAEISKSLGESISVRDSCLVALQTKQAEFDKYKAFNDRTIDYDKLERKLNEALGQLAQKDIEIKEGLKTKSYEISVVKEKHDELIKQSLLTKSHYEGLVKQKTKEKSVDTKFDRPFVVQQPNAQRIPKLSVLGKTTPFIDSLERKYFPKTRSVPKTNVSEGLSKPVIAQTLPQTAKKAVIDELESEKVEFSYMYDVILHDCVSKDVMCSYLQSLSDLDALAELQCMYLHKVKECDCLAQRLSKQTDSISKKVHTKLLQRFDKVEKYSISLEIALQNCKVKVKNDTVCNEKASNGFRKEREQYIEIQDLKAKLQDKNMPLTRSVPKANVSEGLSKPVTAQTLPHTAKKDVSNTNVLKPGMYRIDNRIAHTRAPQLPQTVRNTNPRVSTSTGVNHKPTVSRPMLKNNQSRYKVLPNNSQVKAKKTQVEVHPRIPSVSNKMKFVTACKDSLNSRTLNGNVVCATCNKCLVDSNHFACVTKMLNDVHARTKKPTVVPISTRKPKSQANKSIATTHKKKVASKSKKQKPQSYFKIVQLILFIGDSGCTKHMTGNLKLLCNFVEKFLGTVHFGNDQFAPILGYGDLVQGNVMINRVYYIECLNHNLFSVESTSSTPLCLMDKATPTQAWLWHRRLSHLNFDYINLLSKKDIVIGLPKLKYVKDQLCSSCKLSKANRSSFKSKAVLSSKGRLNLLHMNLCGPMRVASINGKKYILVIVDDYSRYTWTLFLRFKDETPEVLKDFLTMIQRNLQAPVITVRTDRGTEFLNKTLNTFFKEEEIEHQTSTAQTPEQNGVVERQNYADVPSQQELDMLFGPLYDEFFNAGSNPSTNIQSTSAPSHAEENNNDQAEEGEHIPDDKFTNPFCTPTQEVAESSSHNIGNSHVPTFNQPQVFEYRWTKDHPLEQVHKNPSRPVQTRRQLAIDPEICMYALTVLSALRHASNEN